MGNLISTKPSKGGITDFDRAVLSLKAQRKKLEDQSKLLEKRIDQNVSVARELIQQQKRDRALLALKKKKLNEHQLSQLQKYILNAEEMLSNMELTKQQQRIFGALKEGNEALKRTQKELSVEDVEQLVEDTAEARDYQARVAQALSQQLDEGDTEAVLQELQQLEVDVHGVPLEEQGAAEMEALPAAPTTKVEVPQEGVALQDGEQQAQQQQEAAAKEAAERPRLEEPLLA